MKRGPLHLTQVGWAIALPAAILMVVGLASIYVTDTHYASGHDGPRNAVKQLVSILLSTAAFVAILMIGYQRIGRFSYALFAAALVLLVVPVAAKVTHQSFGGLVTPRNGAFRWINLPGLQLQPSEVMKVAYVLALAWYLRHRSSFRQFSGLMVPLLFSAIPAALILLQPDLGMVMLLLPVLFGMLFMAGARLLHLGIIVLLGLGMAPLAWDQIHGYQRQRVAAVLLQSDQLRQAVIENPEPYKKLATRRQALEWKASAGYQLVHSKNAIGSGGLLGNGWGRGIYVENQLLPDRHNDFVIAVVGHQWGLLGCLGVLGCYLVMIVAGSITASATPEPFGRLVSVGVVALLAAQVIINVGMAVGLMPITGMTLPFVSYGGSSLLTNLAAIALLISVSQHRPYLMSNRPFEFSGKRDRGMLAEKPSRPQRDGAGQGAGTRESARPVESR